MAKSSVDLLTSIPQPKSTWEKIFDWTFSIGRYLVVIVEAVVIVAFVLRFAMDRVKNDLDNRITQSVALLEFYDEAGKIDKINLTYNTTVGARTILTSQPTYSGLVTDVNELVGDSCTIQSINIRNNELRVKGVCDSLTLSAEIENAFRTSATLINVRYDLTSSDSSGGEVQYSVIADIPSNQYKNSFAKPTSTSTTNGE
jgi:hypothetical protein